jgi:hypothetical protein
MELVTILFVYPQAILQFLEIGILDSVDCGKSHMIYGCYRNDRTAQYAHPTPMSGNYIWH